MNQSKAILLFIALLFFVLITNGQTGGDYTITQSVIANGGGQNLAGGAFTLDGTIGQAVAGNALTNSPFAVTSGFWNFTPMGATASGVSLSGTLKTERGIGIRRVALTLTDATTGAIFYASSGINGYYRFEDVPAGRGYILTIRSKLYSFVPNTHYIMLFEELTDVDFIASGKTPGKEDR